MIKILFFIENPLSSGGAEKVLRDLVNHMDLETFDITVQTLWPCEPEKYLAKGIHYASVYPAKSRLYRYIMRLENRLGLIYRRHMKKDYDIEVAYLEHATTQILSHSTNRKAKKLAWVHCDFSVMARNPRDYARRTAKFYAKYDRVVCVSQKAQESFRELYGETPTSCVIYNVIDDQLIQERAALPLPEGIQKRRTTMVAVGTLYAPKNFTRLLKSHKRLLKEGIEHDLWIVGEGEERPLLKHSLPKTV